MPSKQSVLAMALTVLHRKVVNIVMKLPNSKAFYQTMLEEF
ncbi:Uncharacterised protein [Pseudomonas putida]|nr:Uncharacterised protein [Pseudomonas putida]CAB5718883.1 Uncharacterised protein [Aeromonas hydrophila]